MDSKPLTISDIARLAGVSKKSVSRVINAERGVSEKTRARILAIMRKQGYEPDRRARALARRQSFLLALAYDNPNADYVLDVLNGMLRVAIPRGYEVIMHPVDDAGTATGERLASFVRRSGCDGLVVIPPLSERAELLAEFAWPAVRIAGDDVTLRMPQVRYDDRAAALAITTQLLDLGHRRIGFVGGPQGGGSTRRRLAGFRDAFASRTLEPDPALLAWGDFTFSGGIAAAQVLLAGNERPSALMCCNDQMAIGVLHAAHEMGLAVPADLSVTGFDDAPVARVAWPPLSTVRQPVLEMGAAAGTALIDAVEGRAAPGGLVEFTHVLVSRRSSAPLSS